jgi:hypothetical protein
MTLDFDGCFDRFRSSAFRLESLPRYSIPGDAEAIAVWRSGRARPQFSVLTSPWAARLATTSMAGKTWRRVRAVDLPLSDYVRWEMAAYAESSVLGEEIRILRRSGPFAGLAQDFWLFDADTDEPFAIAMVYDDEGQQGEHRLVEDPEMLGSYDRLARSTWASAVPLNEFAAAAREQPV